MAAPELLVLDAEHWVQRLRGQAAVFAAQGKQACADAMFVPNLISLVIENLRDRHYAARKLSSLCGEIAAELCSSGGGVVPRELAPVIREFGQAMLAQLIEAQAFGLDGVLNYRFRLLPRPQDNTTVVLQRVHELPFENYDLP